LGVHPT